MSEHARKLDVIDVNPDPMCRDVQASTDRWDVIWNATPGCDGRIVSNFYGGGGVKCTKCKGWFCF